MPDKGDNPSHETAAESGTNELKADSKLDVSASQSTIQQPKFIFPANCIVVLNGQKCQLKLNPETGLLVAQPLKITDSGALVPPPVKDPSVQVEFALAQPVEQREQALGEPAPQDCESENAAQGLLKLSTGNDDEEALQDSSENSLSSESDGEPKIPVPKLIIPSAGGRVTVTAITQKQVSAVTKLEGITIGIGSLDDDQDDDTLDPKLTETDAVTLKPVLKQYLISPGDPSDLSVVMQSSSADSLSSGNLGKLGLKTSGLDLEKLRCNDCAFQAYYPQQYDNHLRQVHANSLHRCKCCSFICLVEDELKKHFEDIHPRNICDVCHFMSEHAYVIKRHMYRHTSDGCTCEVCGKTYKDQYILKMHMKMVHMPAEILYECNVCTKKFTRKAHLKRHQRTHATNKAFKCPHCDYRGCERSDVTKHQLIHEAPRHVCEICGKSFRHQKNKDLHLKRHAGQRDYKCGVCDFFGYTFTDIRKHIERRHSDMKMILCDKCGMTFKSEYLLQEHRMTWHNSEHMTIIDASSDMVDAGSIGQDGTTLGTDEDHIARLRITGSEGEKLAVVFNTDHELDSEAFTSSVGNADGTTEINDLTITLC